MPDGMATPEKKSEVPISPSVQALRQLEWKSEIPQPVDLLGGEGAGVKAKESAEYYARHYPAEGRANVEKLKTATERHQLIHFAREVMRMYEDVEFHPEPSISDYRYEDVVASLRDRQSAMENSLDDLVLLEVVEKNSIKDDGTAIFRDSGFEYRKSFRKIEGVVAKHYDPEGDLISIEKADPPIEVYEIGSDLQRSELAEDLKQEIAEMMARQDMVKMLRWVWNQTENLEGLVEFYYKGSLTAEAMYRLCNAEGRTAGFTETRERISALTKTEGGAEYRKGHEFGDAKSVALKCFEIAGLSEDPKALEELLKRPGIRELFKIMDGEIDTTDQAIDDLFLKPADRNNRPLNPTLVKWIGQPWAWEREVRSGKEDLKSEPGPNFEDDDGNPKPGDVRGLLTEKGNILCDSSWEDAEYIFQQVERFLGGGEKAPMFAMKDANDAMFLAWMELRVTGMATEYGRQKYEKGVYHDMGRMTSCDRVKVMYPEVFRFIYKFLKTEIRDYGPDGSFGKYPERFAVHYFKAWSSGTKYGERTFQEMRWGYRKEELKHVDANGKEIMIEHPEEEFCRLGKLPWRKLSPKAYNSAALGPFIAGRKELGLFQYAMRTEWERLEIFKNHDFWRKIAKHLGIALSPEVVFDGKFRGIYTGDKIHDKNIDPWVGEQVRNYKKRYFLAFWDGLRSLPQWREWQAISGDKVDSATSPISIWPIDRIKFRLGRVGILTPEEASELPTDFYFKGKDEFRGNDKRF